MLEAEAGPARVVGREQVGAQRAGPAHLHVLRVGGEDHRALLADHDDHTRARQHRGDAVGERAAVVAARVRVPREPHHAHHRDQPLAIAALELALHLRAAARRIEVEVVDAIEVHVVLREADAAIAELRAREHLALEPGGPGLVVADVDHRLGHAWPRGAEDPASLATPAAGDVAPRSGGSFTTMLPRSMGCRSSARSTSSPSSAQSKELFPSQATYRSGCGSPCRLRPPAGSA